MKPYSKINNHVCHKRSMLLVILIVSMLLPVQGQIQSQWDWVVGFGGQKSDVGKAVCTDQNGNVYITGYFQDNANFGSVELIANGDTDIFLAKLDQFGNFLWIRQFGSEVHKNLIATEMGNAICTDEKGNVYLTGIFSLSTVFGDTTLNSMGGDDIFVAKLNSNGKVLWAGNYGSSTHDIVYDICISENGNIILTGVFGTKPSNRSFNITKSSSYAFVASINRAGKMELIRAVSGTGYVGAKAVTTDENNNIYWGINFRKDALLSQKNITSNGGYDIIVEKISPLGETLWIKTIGGSGADKVSSLSTINGNELLLVGSFEEKITIDGETLVSTGSSDFLICQFDKTGNLMWLEQIGGKLDDKGVSISSTIDGNIIVGGNFQGEIMAGYDTLISSGYYDIAVFSFNGDHQLQGAKQFGNDQGDFLNSLAIGNKSAYFTGHFRGDLAVNDLDVKSIGRDDIILVSFPFSESYLGTSEETIWGNNLTFSINPNPSNGIFSITSNHREHIIVDIKVNDASGSHVLVFKDYKLPGIIDLSSLSNGVYIVHIRFNDNSFIKKVVIKH